MSTPLPACLASSPPPQGFATGVPAPSSAETGSLAASSVAALDSVVKRYRKTEALRGLDLTLRRGEVVALSFTCRSPSRPDFSCR